MGVEEGAGEERLFQETTSDVVEDFIESARFGDIDEVMSIAATGVSLDATDSQGRTALHMASANVHLSIVEYLVQNGADVSARNLENNTPLHWASLNGHTEVVKCLILAGANISFLNSHERTPLDEALGSGKLSVVDAINEAAAQLELSGTRVS